MVGRKQPNMQKKKGLKVTRADTETKSELAFYSVAIRTFTMGEGYLCFITYFKNSLCIEWAGPDPEEHPVLPEINR